MICPFKLLLIEIPMDQVGLGFLALDQAEDILSVHPHRKQSQKNATGYDDPVAKVEHDKSNAKAHGRQNASKRDITGNGKGDHEHRKDD